MVSCWKATFTESKLLTITFVTNFWFEIFVPVLDLKVSFEQKAGIHDYLILKTSISGPLLFANPYVILPLLNFFFFVSLARCRRSLFLLVFLVIRTFHLTDEKGKLSYNSLKKTIHEQIRDHQREGRMLEVFKVSA